MLRTLRVSWRRFGDCWLDAQQKGPTAGWPSQTMTCNCYGLQKRLGHHQALKQNGLELRMYGTPTRKQGLRYGNYTHRHPCFDR